MRPATITPKQRATQVQILPVQVFELMVLPLKMQLVTVAKVTLHRMSCELVVVEFVICVLSSDVVVSVDPRQLDLFFRCDAVSVQPAHWDDESTVDPPDRMQGVPCT